MNPRLRLHRVLARLAALLAVTTMVAMPLSAESRPLEFQIENPNILAIIDDPDPTGRLRPREPIVRSEDEQVMLYGQAGSSSPASTLYAAPMPAPLAAWARRSRSGFDIVISRLVRGAWTSPEIVAGSPADELDPQLTRDPSDGSVHLVYWIADPAPVVVHRWAPADLSVWSAPVVVSAPGEPAARPAACFQQGRLRVVYESLGDPRLIVLATRTASGFTTEVVAATHHPLPGWPQVHSRGDRMWVEWIDGADEMGWRRSRPDGGWEPVAQEPIATPVDRVLARGRIGWRAGE